VLLWDQHGCLPLRADAPIDGLLEYADNGIGFVSVNVGFDANAWTEVVHILANFRSKVLAKPDELVLVDTAADVVAAHETGRLAVSFDLEGADALDGDAAMVEAYHRLGVRTMLIAYNHANRAGGGCHGDPRQGLTAFGCEVVAEMNRVGMLVDATHCSLRTTMDLFERSSTPVVFSHSVPRGVFDHERNVSDEQLRACAATGGVIGINGVGLFLGDPSASTEALFRAVDYAVEIVGPDHVGLGLDYVVDKAELDAWMTEHQDVFPPEAGYSAGMRIAGPAQLPGLAALLRVRGYEEEHVRAIMGGNFLRVARDAWCPEAERDRSGDV
jgi:membrane dipeptidase